MLTTLKAASRSVQERARHTRRSAWETPVTTAARAINLNLVVLFFFALAALVFLTRTTVSVAQVNDSVAAAINPETTGIAHDTRLTGKLDDTVTETAAVAHAVKPIPSYLSRAGSALHSIQADAASTDDSVANIEQSVRGIGGSVSNMREPVDRLGDGVGVIKSRAGTITAALSGTADATAAMAPEVAASDSSMYRIQQALNEINPVLGGIASDLEALSVHTRRLADNGLIKLGSVLQNILSGLLGQP